MNPRKSLASWQVFAQRFGGGEIGFAMRAGLRNDTVVSGAHYSAVHGQDCYPFPSPWPDPSRVRSFFCANVARPVRRLAAICAKICIFWFASDVIVVELATRPTTIRGSSKCANLLSLSPLSPCHWPAASVQTRPRPAPALALPAVRPWVRSPKTKSRNPRWSVARLACWQATKACAADTTSLEVHFALAASRGHPPAGRLHFYASVPDRGTDTDGREPCSRKS